MINLFQVGLSLLIRRASAFSHTTKMLIQRFVPFPAVGKSCTERRPVQVARET